MKSIHGKPRRDGVRGDERIRTAELSLGTDLSYETFCEHGYVYDDAEHPAAGLERCPVCRPLTAGETLHPLVRRRWERHL